MAWVTAWRSLTHRDSQSPAACAGRGRRPAAPGAGSPPGHGPATLGMDARLSQGKALAPACQPNSRPPPLTCEWGYQVRWAPRAQLAQPVAQPQASPHTRLGNPARLNCQGPPRAPTVSHLCPGRVRMGAFLWAAAPTCTQAPAGRPCTAVQVVARTRIPLARVQLSCCQPHCVPRARATSFFVSQTLLAAVGTAGVSPPGAPSGLLSCLLSCLTPATPAMSPFPSPSRTSQRGVGPGLQVPSLF